MNSAAISPPRLNFASLALGKATKESAVIPPVPERLEDTGLPPTFYEQHILKILYFRGEIFGRPPQAPQAGGTQAALGNG